MIKSHLKIRPEYNSQHSLVGRNRGKKMRENPQGTTIATLAPIRYVAPATPEIMKQTLGLDLTPAAPAPAPESAKRKLSPAGEIFCTIRNKGSNEVLSHEDRLDLLDTLSADLTRQILLTRTRYGIQHPLQPMPSTAYCAPSARTSVGSTLRGAAKPQNTPSTPHPSAPAPASWVSAPATIGLMLDDLAERTRLSDSARDYHTQRHAIISAYAGSRAYFSAALIPSNPSKGIKFGDSAIQKELAPEHPQAIYPLCQLALSQAVANAQEEYARLTWRATWPLSVFPIQPGVALGRAQSKQTDAPVYRIETRYAEVLTGIDTRIEAKNSLIPDYAEYTESHYVPTTVTRVRVLAKPETVITLLDPTKLLPDHRARETVDHGVTPEQFADIESALRADTIAPVESTRAHMADTLALTTPAQLEPSENNYLIATKNLSNETVTVTSAKTARQADYMAGQIHRAHPNTSSMVLSRVQARAARLDTLIAEYAAKHPEEYTSHVS